jgi:hypothetical protein
VDGLEDVPARAIRIDAGTATRLGLAIGGVVELVNRRGAPLRAWIVGLDAADGEAAVAPTALRMLGAPAGAEFELRAVHSGRLG